MGAWDNPRIELNLYKIIEKNSNILIRILNSSKKELIGLANKNPKSLSDILHALVSRGFFKLDSDDILTYEQNILRAFDIGTNKISAKKFPVQLIVKQSTSDSSLKYIRRLDGDIRKDMAKVLTEGYKNKVPSNELVNKMAVVLDKKKGRAGTIVRTETMRATNIGSWSQSKNIGANYFVVDYRSNACVNCIKRFKGKVFSIKEIKYLPPYHSNCACIPIFYKSRAEALGMSKDVIKRNTLELRKMKKKGIEIPEDGSGPNINLKKLPQPTKVKI